MFTKTLSGTAQNSLAVLGKSGLLKGAYLAGGSALALHFGHRQSIDFDFFTQKHFMVKDLYEGLYHAGKFQKTTLKRDTLLGVFNEVKFSYFHYPYPLIKKTSQFLGVEIADPADIAAMKIAAVVDRGTKKDFIDLYFLVKNGYSLEKIFAFYNQKYQKLAENVYSIIRSISYFADAEVLEEPIMLKKVSWNEVKKYFKGESIRLGKKYL